MPTAATELWRVLLLNQIAEEGLDKFPQARYKLVKEGPSHHAILLRSHDLHSFTFSSDLLAVARAGVGVNNIPVAELSRKGIPVFNTPGANANAVKELVIASLIIGARNLYPSLRYTDRLPVNDEMAEAVEKGKKQFSGIELTGRTLGVIGLGKIGCMVANAALKLGMKVMGYDPDITVDAAWNLSAEVHRAENLKSVLRHSQFVSMHVPLTTATHHLLNTEALKLLPQHACVLNFSREEVVDSQAIRTALADKHLASYLCDFPSPIIAGQEGVVAFPHLGASTQEAELNCATMAVNQLRAFLEDGTIHHSVNFPMVNMARESAYRVGIANANVPNMLGKISTTMAEHSLNIHNMINKSRGEMAYTLVDVDSPVSHALLTQLRAIEGVLTVRYLPRLMEA